eukprot:8464782-Pyramimonas_sp.AAC.1
MVGLYPQPAHRPVADLRATRKPILGLRQGYGRAAQAVVAIPNWIPRVVPSNEIPPHWFPSRIPVVAPSIRILL